MSAAPLVRPEHGYGFIIFFLVCTAPQPTGCDTRDSVLVVLLRSGVLNPNPTRSCLRIAELCARYCMHTTCRVGSLPVYMMSNSVHPVVT
ncbi:hypothetical protein EDB84DRAFT_477195 [Lactarius hengduanensis]|nr:hypothetical protein EDB84DRAFT_477195 [Lactarius hengduanensis]